MTSVSLEPRPGHSPGDQVPSGLQRLRTFVSRRRHVTSKKELLEAGFTESQIRSWRVSGRLVNLFRGVYSYGRDIETRDAAWRAALLAAGPKSALTGRSALEKWGAIKLARPIPWIIEVATEGDRKARHRGLSPALRSTIVKVVRRRFEAGDIRLKDGLPLLRAASALIDFAATATEKDLRFAFLELCRLRLFRKEDVAFCFRKSTGRRGAAKLKPLLRLWVPELNRIRSVFEGLFLLAWVERRFVMPKVNEKIFGFEVDFYWPHMRLVLELDGRAFHSDPIARQRDLEKTRLLESKGLRVIRISWREFMADPAALIEKIARELRLL